MSWPSSSFIYFIAFFLRFRGPRTKLDSQGLDHRVQKAEGQPVARSRCYGFQKSGYEEGGGGDGQSHRYWLNLESKYEWALLVAEQGALAIKHSPPGAKGQGDRGKCWERGAWEGRDGQGSKSRSIRARRVVGLGPAARIPTKGLALKNALGYSWLKNMW